MQVQVEKTEKGFALLIPDELVQNSHVKAGSLVDLTLVDDKFVIAPIRRSKYTTEELLSGVTDENIHGETDWGPPVGKEIW
jgi:antitoxin MazE